MFITPWEVVKYSPLNKEFPVDVVSNVIRQTERSALNDLLGSDFIEVLYNDLKQDNNVYIEYRPGSNYMYGTKVIYNGLRYEANVTTTRDPGNTSDWALYEIFNEPKFNDLWVQYLRDFLAYEIAEPALTFATFQAKGNGLMRFADQNTGAITAHQSDFGLYKKELETQRDRIKKLMIQWIKDAHETYTNPDDSLFKTVLFIATDCTTNYSNKVKSGRFLLRY
jgi:hypothetical protein